MIRFFTLLRGRFRPIPDGADWRRNPLAHPRIRQMTEREKADLPFDPATILPD